MACELREVQFATPFPDGGNLKLRKAQIIIEKEEKAARLEAKKIASENAKVKAELKIKKRDLQAQKAADFKLRKAQIVMRKKPN